MILALNVGNDFGQPNGLANIGVANRTFKIEIYLRDVKVWVDEKNTVLCCFVETGCDIEGSGKVTIQSQWFPVVEMMYVHTANYLGGSSVNNHLEEIGLLFGFPSKTHLPAKQMYTFMFTASQRSS